MHSAFSLYVCRSPGKVVFVTLNMPDSYVAQSMGSMNAGKSCRAQPTWLRSADPQVPASRGAVARSMAILVTDVVLFG